MKLRHFDEAVMFHCPGCGHDHMVYVENVAEIGLHPMWDFNGNDEAPTFHPSILIRTYQWTPPVTPENLHAWRAAPWPQHKVEKICHSFVTDGRIQFLDDCTHYLAGQTVGIPDWTQP